VLGLDFEESKSNKHHDVARVGAVPQRTRYEGAHRRKSLRITFRLGPVNQSQHYIVLEPVVDRNVPVLSYILECGRSFNGNNADLSDVVERL
jgi:hypothetical protein